MDKPTERGETKMNDKTKSAPKEAEMTIYKCHNCGFEYYEKANYCTQCGHKQQLTEKVIS